MAPLMSLGAVFAILWQARQAPGVPLYNVYVPSNIAYWWINDCLLHASFFSQKAWLATHAMSENQTSIDAGNSLLWACV